MKKITLKDIAEKAGVSIALISNYLNNHPSARMSKETKERIDLALKELDYHGSDIARSLRTGESRIIGYFSENLKNEVNQREMLKIFDVAAEEKYRVIAGSSSSSGKTLENIRAFQACGCDAMIVSGFFNQEYTEQIANMSVPTIILNTHPTASLPGKMLRYDYRSAINEAVNFLRKHGHKGIYYQTYYKDPNDQRYLEFAETVSEENVWNLQMKDTDPQDVKRFLSAHPDCTAILHLNDFLALKTIQNCAQLGLRVPEDLSVIGFDNILSAEYTTPSLSSIRRPLTEAAQHAVCAALAVLKKKTNSLPESLPCQFIPRKSVK